MAKRRCSHPESVRDSAQRCGRSEGRSQVQCSALGPVSPKPQETGSTAVPVGWLVGAVLLGSGCDQLIVTWQRGSWGVLSTLFSPSSCLHARASCWVDTGRRRRAGGHHCGPLEPSVAWGTDEGGQGCLMLSLVELRGGRPEGRKASPKQYFLEDTFLIPACAPTCLCACDLSLCSRPFFAVCVPSARVWGALCCAH